jgi:acyl-coenzyme A thioesterase PaaI-like protein
MNAKLLRFGMNLWGPFVGSGIHVMHISPDYREANVRLRLGLWNRNSVGVHFGGSLFAMTDPFFMVMVQHNLGHEYRVWDQAAKIDFIKPGTGKVEAHFTLHTHELDEIRQAAVNGAKVLRDFTVEVKDQQGEIVARVCKTLYVRLKKRTPSKEIERAA